MRADVLWFGYAMIGIATMLYEWRHNRDKITKEIDSWPFPSVVCKVGFIVSAVVVVLLWPMSLWALLRRG